MCSFGESAPGPAGRILSNIYLIYSIKNTIRLCSLSVSLTWLSPWDVPPCKLSQNWHLYTPSLSLSQVPGLKLFFNAQNQPGAVSKYLLGWNHPRPSSQNQHPASERLTYKFFLSALKSAKHRQQQNQSQSSTQHRQARISDQTQSE